jgi:hypothetical protein
MFLPNLPEWPIAALGAMTAGGVVSGANSMSTSSELAYQLRDANARFVVTIAQFLSTVREAANKLGRVTTIVLGEAPEAVSFASLLTCADEEPPPVFGPESLAALPYSSGTSGLPKGVMLTQRAYARLQGIAKPHDHPVAIPTRVRRDVAEGTRKLLGTFQPGYVTTFDGLWSTQPRERRIDPFVPYLRERLAPIQTRVTLPRDSCAGSAITERCSRVPSANRRTVFGAVSAKSNQPNSCRCVTREVSLAPHSARLGADIQGCPLRGRQNGGRCAPLIGRRQQQWRGRVRFTRESKLIGIV